MERVAFLIEETGQRIGCMLNPEGLMISRTAGIRAAQSLNGQLTSSGLSDDPLLYTGGGRTELQLELLFDVHLAGTTIQTNDVRDLTSPLWKLAENAGTNNQYGKPTIVRFVWGKSWNILGVVAAVAERFENFTSSGQPQRSWLRMRFLRVAEPIAPSPLPETNLLTTPALLEKQLNPETSAIFNEETVAQTPPIAAVHPIIADGTVGENLPYLASLYLGDPALWRWLAWFNDLLDPVRLVAGTVLNIPAAPPNPTP